jgi:hypothetical protein
MDLRSKISIGILTHAALGRADYLDRTLTLLSAGTDFGSKRVRVIIFYNGWDESFHKVEVFKYPQLEITKIITPTNIGVGAGINRLNEVLLRFETEYTFLLEADWYLLPSTLSNTKENWLQECIKHLDSRPDIDQIVLRRYLHDIDNRQYMYANWILPQNVVGTFHDRETRYDYIEVTGKEYANPPHIARIKNFYSKEVLPLTEYYDQDLKPVELKGNEQWGLAEITAASKGAVLTTIFFQYGVFIHGDNWQHGYDKDTNLPEWHKLEASRKICGKYPASGGCKYGFIDPRVEFCLCCDSNSREMSGLQAHENFFINTILVNVGHSPTPDDYDRIVQLSMESGIDPE